MNKNSLRLFYGNYFAIFIYDSDFTEAYGMAEAMRDKYDVSLFRRPKKMKVFLDKLAASGFSGFVSEDNMSVKSFE